MPASLPNLAEDDRLFEIVDGQRVEVQPMGMYAAVFATLLAHRILSYALPRKLGIATTEGLIDLGPGQNQRRPDVSYFRFDEWPADADIRIEDPPSCSAIPALAVEIVSRTNTSDEVEDKIQEYFAAGVAEVWTIHPRHELVRIFSSPIECKTVRFADEIDASSVLPGFKIRLADVCDMLKKGL